MAEVIGIASGIAGLITLAMEVTALSYRFIADIRSAQVTQKQYLREMSALTDVLLRSEEAAQSLEGEPVSLNRPVNLSKDTIHDCANELQDLRAKMEKPTSSMLWPLKEKTLKKHIEDLARFRDIFSGFLVAQTLVTASATHREVTQIGHYREQTELLDWIGRSKETSRPVSAPLPGTGEWFLKSNAYQNWAKGNESSLLWCHGSPGVGKSMLAYLALQHLSEALETESFCIVHYFCDFANRKQQTKEEIWRSILRQVIARGQSAVLQALANSTKRARSARSPSPQDLSDALLTVCSTQQVVFVFDGPDELESLKDFKAILKPFMKAESRVMVTSRDLPEIRSALAAASLLEVEAKKHDLAQYVASQFEDNDMEDLLEKHPDLETEIVDKANGIFLLLEILLENILELSTVKEMRKALQSYPVHLDQAFESSLARIDAQSASHRSLAHRVIGWVTSAERKLLMTELVHGLATEEGLDAIDDENVLSPKMLLKVCGGLVVTNPRDSTVNMVHATVYSWFRQREPARFHEDLARSCLRYLAMRPLSVGPARTGEELDERIKTLPFLSYASQHWRQHILDQTMESSLSGPIDRLLDNNELRSAAFQASNYKGRVSSSIVRSATFDSMPTGHSAVHVAAYWNLPQKLQALLEDGLDLNAVDSQRWTPLHWACFAFSQDVIPVLVSRKVEIDAKDSVGWTPLFWTALTGNITALELLLSSGADHLVRDVHGWTPLRWAVASQQAEAVRAFLRHHSNSVSTAHESQTASAIDISVQEFLRSKSHRFTSVDVLAEFHDEREIPAQDGGRFADLAGLLQDESFDISQLWNRGHFDPPVGNTWRTMRKAEMANGFEDYIRRSAHIEMSNEAWKSRLLHAAVRDGNLLAVRLLIELGADVNWNSTRSPLHAAAFRKDPSFAELLIENGAEIEAQDYQGLTALQQAVLNGFEETAKLLLSKGANPNFIHGEPEKLRRSSRLFRSYSEGGIASSRTALMLACGLDMPEDCDDLPTRMVRLLLGNGVDINVQDAASARMTAIHYAARSRNPRVLELIVEAGADSSALDAFGRTTVHHLVLGRSSRSKFDSVGVVLPGPATVCLEFLRDKCGTDFLSQKAEWGHYQKRAHSTYVHGLGVHTPLSLAIMEGDWELFHALHGYGARFETSIALEPLFYGPFQALQPKAIDILIKHGGVLSTKQYFPRPYILRDHPDLQPAEVTRLKEVMEKLIPLGFDVDDNDWHGKTLLHEAAGQLGSRDLTKTLLELGADPALETDDGLDTLLITCLAEKFDALWCIMDHVKLHPLHDHWTQYLDLSETLQEANVLPRFCAAIKAAGKIDLPRTSKGWTLLHFAAKHGYAAAIKCLINEGADMEALDADERTPLHIASVEGHNKVVDALLSKGASVDKADRQGWQALHFAALANHTEVAHSIILAGAPTQVATTSLTQQAEFRRPSGLWAGHNWTGTPLHLAAMTGNIDIVRLLLDDKRVDVNARTDNFAKDDKDQIVPPTPGAGPTALHIALDTGKFYGRHGSALDENRLEIASLLVEHGAGVEGVANHLQLAHLKQFERFPALWDKLRGGITIGSSA